MKTWTPLWSSIIDSSIWGESKEVRLLWITILAKKDRDGIIEASMPGLARAAGISLEECVEALKKLEGPDPFSSSQDFEGRRIKRVDGGWCVLNHQKYRDEIRKQYRREYNRRKQAEYRASKKGAGPLPGEAAYVKAERNGASEEELDRLSDPSQSGAGTV